MRATQAKEKRAVAQLFKQISQGSDGKVYCTCV